MPCLTCTIYILTPAFERKQWEPLLDCLTPEWQAHARACCLEKGISLTALLRQINSQLPSNLSRKPYNRQVFPWLVRKGLVERTLSGNKWVYWPTPEGEEKGIVWDESNRNLQWSFAGQQFLVDNLEAIVQDLASGEAYRLGADPQRPEGA